MRILRVFPSPPTPHHPPCESSLCLAFWFLYQCFISQLDISNTQQLVLLTGIEYYLCRAFVNKSWNFTRHIDEKGRKAFVQYFGVSILLKRNGTNVLARSFHAFIIQHLCRVPIYCSYPGVRDGAVGWCSSLIVVIQSNGWPD